MLARQQLENAWNNKTNHSTSSKDGASSAAAVGKKQLNRKRKLDQVEEDAEGKDEEENTLNEAGDGNEEANEVFGSYLEYPPLHRLLGDVSESSEKTREDGEEGKTGPASSSQGQNQDSAPKTLTISIALDKLSPLAEAKWLKTGNVNEWLSSILPPPSSSMGSRDSKSQSKLLSSQVWFNKIKVSDPDPPPTIQDVFSDWSTKSFLGQPKDRRKFLKDSVDDSKGMIEILCRLVRGERASSTTPRDRHSIGDGDYEHKNDGEEHQDGEIDPLEKAKKLTNFVSNHTHLSLSVLALFGLAKDYSVRAGVEEEELKKKIGEILKSLPEHLIFKALDGLVSLTFILGIVVCDDLTILSLNRYPFSQWREVMERERLTSNPTSNRGAGSSRGSASTSRGGGGSGRKPKRDVKRGGHGGRKGGRSSSVATSARSVNGD